MTTSATMTTPKVRRHCPSREPVATGTPAGNGARRPGFRQAPATCSCSASQRSSLSIRRQRLRASNGSCPGMNAANRFGASSNRTAGHRCLKASIFSTQSSTIIGQSRMPWDTMGTLNYLRVSMITYSPPCDDRSRGRCPGLLAARRDPARPDRARRDSASPSAAVDQSSCAGVRDSSRLR